MKNRLMVALDVPDMDRALAVRSQLGVSVGWFKVGLRLFVACGPRLVRQLLERNRIFLDLKFYDIPNTVAQAVESAGRLGVHMLNVHAAGGRAMLHAAAEAASMFPAMRLIAVTVLTSDPMEADKAKSLVIERAVMAREAGVHGVVCSAHEVAAIKQACGDEFLCVTPGIRWGGQSADDQHRVATPGLAILNGADYIVVGRPILSAVNPLAVTNQALKEMRHAVHA